MVDKVAIELKLRAVIAQLNEINDVLGGDPEERRARVKTLSDSLDWPSVEAEHGTQPALPREEHEERDVESHELCRCCGVGLVAPAEMQLWSRKVPRG